MAECQISQIFFYRHCTGINHRKCCGDPDITAFVLAYILDIIICYRVFILYIVLKNFYTIGVIQVQPVLCTDPYKAFAILEYGSDLAA
jgi:hypothetical protein